MQSSERNAFILLPSDTKKAINFARTNKLKEFSLVNFMYMSRGVF